MSPVKKSKRSRRDYLRSAAGGAMVVGVAAWSMLGLRGLSAQQVPAPDTGATAPNDATAGPNQNGSDTAPVPNGTNLAPSPSGPPAQARQVTVNGVQMGEVDVYGRSVIQIHENTRGYTALDRARVVAGRLNDAAARGRLNDVRVGTMNGQIVVLAGGEQIITATDTGAAAAHTTPYALAQQWAGNLKTAIQPHYEYQGSTALGAPQTRDSYYSEPSKDKVVPILSAGTGLRVGAAVVTGPESKVAQTVAIGQIETKWKNTIEVRVLVPINNPTDLAHLRRVPEVSVYAVGNYRL